MFSARTFAKTGRSLYALRLASTRRLTPQLTSTAMRSFWDQKQPEQPKSYKTESDSSQSSSKMNEPPLPPPDADSIERDYIQADAASVFSPYFFGVLAVGLGLITYGLVGLFEMMTMWPKEIRGDLRGGLRAKRKGDTEIAVQYLTRAWNEARALPRAAFGEQALLKISGIGIALAGITEEAGQLERAYTVFQDVLHYMRTAHLGGNVGKDVNTESDTLQAPLTGPERMRTVALAYKLGELASKLNKTGEEEKWLVLSVETILRLLNTPAPDGSTGTRLADHKGFPPKALVENLGLPAMFVRYNIAAPFEALGSFYSRHDNPTYALPLYLQAISILIPPAPAVVDIEDKCRGAALMGNIAELITRYQVRNEQSPEAVLQAESWAQKGLDLVTSARKSAVTKCETCEEAYAVLLYNLAMIRDLTGDANRARQLLNESLEQSKAMGLDEGIKHANSALDSLTTQSEVTTVKPFVADSDIIAASSLE